MAKVDWNGDDVMRRMAAAAAVGVNLTMGDCVRGARREHEYVDQTGFLTASTDIREPAHLDGTMVEGTWGSDADYALFVEIGTSRIGPTATEREVAADGDMWDVADPKPEPGVTVRQEFTIVRTGPEQEDFITLHRPSRGTGPLMPQRPFLRPQADLNYPLLAMHIGDAFKSGG